MRQSQIALLTLSFAFLCSDNNSCKLFADSYIPYDLEDDYDEDDEDIVSSNTKISQVRQSGSSQQNNYDEEPISGPACCPEIIEDCCYCNVCPPTEMITPPAGPCVVGGKSAYLTANFIYWTARENGTAIAATTGFANPPQTGIPNTQQGSVIRFDEDYKPGFKVGLGLDFCHDGWDIFAEYTWYHTTKNKSASAPTLPNTQGVQFPTAVAVPIPGLGLSLWDCYWGVNGNNTSIGSNTVFTLAGTTPDSIVYGNVNGRWRLNFNAFNLELGRNFYISRRLMLRPHFGLKGAWQKQNLSVAFTNGIDNFNSSLVTFAAAPNSYMSQKMSNWGIGPRVGVNTSWHFTRDFSLLGNIALTGLFEHFSIRRFDFANLPPANISPNSSSFVHFKSTFDTIEPIIEWLIGLRFESWFLCDRYHVALDAGWESQIWFGQNQFLRNRVMESSEGNLSLAGLTVQARFDF